MITQPLPPAPSFFLRYARQLWLALALFWIVMICVTGSAMLRGEPDAYHNQHARLLLTALGSLSLSLFGLASRNAVKAVLIVVSYVFIGTMFWFGR